MPKKRPVKREIADSKNNIGYGCQKVVAFRLFSAFQPRIPLETGSSISSPLYLSGNHPTTFSSAAGKMRAESYTGKYSELHRSVSLSFHRDSDLIRDHSAHQAD